MATDKIIKTVRPFQELTAAQVYTTLGDGVTLGVNAEGMLVIEDAFVRMSLGKCTIERLDHMKGYLDQMKPHAVSTDCHPDPVVAE